MAATNGIGFNISGILKLGTQSLGGDAIRQASTDRMNVDRCRIGRVDVIYIIYTIL